MQRTLVLAVLVGLLALACAQQGAAPPDDYEVTMLMLPQGQPEAGRDTFVALGCAGCHTVAWDSELPAPASAELGPELGVDGANSGPGGLATSIVAPSHRVSEKYQARTQGDVSPMTDYTGTLTIRQLADIVAYLKRQGAETQARTGQAAPG